MSTRRRKKKSGPARATVRRSSIGNQTQNPALSLLLAENTTDSSIASPREHQQVNGVSILQRRRQHASNDYSTLTIPITTDNNEYNRQADAIPTRDHKGNNRQAAALYPFQDRSNVAMSSRGVPPIHQDSSQNEEFEQLDEYLPPSSLGPAKRKEVALEFLKRSERCLGKIFAIFEEKEIDIDKSPELCPILRYHYQRVFPFLVEDCTARVTQNQDDGISLKLYRQVHGVMWFLSNQSNIISQLGASAAVGDRRMVFANVRDLYYTNKVLHVDSPGEVIDDIVAVAAKIPLFGDGISASRENLGVVYSDGGMDLYGYIEMPDGTRDLVSFVEKTGDNLYAVKKLPGKGPICLWLEDKPGSRFEAMSLELAKETSTEELTGLTLMHMTLSKTPNKTHVKVLKSFMAAAWRACRHIAFAAFVDGDQGGYGAVRYLEERLGFPIAVAPLKSEHRKDCFPPQRNFSPPCTPPLRFSEPRLTLGGRERPEEREKRRQFVEYANKFVAYTNCYKFGPGLRETIWFLLETDAFEIPPPPDDSLQCPKEGLDESAVLEQLELQEIMLTGARLALKDLFGATARMKNRLKSSETVTCSHYMPNRSEELPADSSPGHQERF